MNSKPKRDPIIDTTALEDGHVVLVSQKTEWANTLSPLAALVWEFCDGTNTVDDIVSNIKAIPELSFDSSLEQEVQKLLTDLEESGFLTVSD